MTPDEVSTPAPVTIPHNVPFIDGTGLISLGAAVPTSIKRLAKHADEIVKKGIPLPPSPFIEWAADRCTGDDRQDLVIFVQGRRGSGKSYSALWLGMRLAEGIAKRKGGKWQDYFSLENSATLEDADKVLRILQTAGKYQVVLIDDCSLAISNRSWNSPQNRNFNALLSICRTNRWILLLTAPLKSHVDNQVREMCDITMTIYRSYHSSGFNICKITSSETSTGPKQKEYVKRLSFHKKKVDAWVSFRPPKELTDKYDRDRDAAALELNTRIVQTGSFKGTGTQTSTEPKVPLCTRHLLDQVALHGDRVKMFLREDPSMSINKLSAKLGLQHQPTQRIVEHLGLKIQPKVKKVAKE